ncbi:MAG: dihydrolipoamide acetyltransferase family protein [Caldilinea sp.]
MPTQVLMPPLSQTLETLVLVEWLKQSGQPVTKGEPLFLVESDKATLEVEAPVSGVVSALLVEPGTEVRVKTPIALIVQPEEAPTLAPALATASPGQRVLEPLPPERLQRVVASPRARAQARAAAIDLAALTPTGPGGMIVARDVAAAQLPARISPLARRTAAAEGIDVDTLAKAHPGRRILRADVLSEVEAANTPNADAAVGQPLSPLRQTIAERLSRSAAVAVTLSCEVDATELVALRQQAILDLAAEKVRPTFTDFFALIVARCLLRSPGINGTFDGVRLNLCEEVQLSLAIDTPRGLVTPVLRNSDLANLRTVAARRIALLEAAAQQRLTPADLAGGTFTLTNLGRQRVDAFTPLINPPQIGVLGTGRIRPAPAVHAGQLAVRQRLVLSLTFDHRVIDGAPAARFLEEVATWIEEPHRIWYG